MPVATDPSQKHDVVLNSDLQCPEDQQATFVFRYMTRRDARNVREVYDGMDKMVDGDAAMDAVCGCIRQHLVGWHNITDRDGETIAFDADRLDDILTDAEMMELFIKMRLGSQLGVADLKKSESPSQPASEEYASDATAGQTA